MSLLARRFDHVTGIRVLKSSTYTFRDRGLSNFPYWSSHCAQVSTVSAAYNNRKQSFRLVKRGCSISRPYSTKEKHGCHDEVSSWNVANAVTMGRIVAAPVTGYCILGGEFGMALGGLLYAGGSDWLDGYLARRFRIRTVMGSYLDPLADKLLISTTTICLAYQEVIPLWLAALIIGRDIGLIAGWSALLGGKTGSFSPVKVFRASGANAIEPLFISKLNTAMQIILSFAGVVYAGDWGLVNESIMNGIGLATAVTTTGSGLTYGLKFLKRRKPPQQ